MQRRLVQLTIPLVLAVSATVCFAKGPGLLRISDHVYAYVGTTNASPSTNSFGANTGVIVGRDGVLVVDSLMFAKEGRRLLADIRKLTPKPVKYVVNTHWHPDHAWGNCAFVKIGAVVIAQDNARKCLPESQSELVHYKEFGISADDIAGTTVVGPSLTFSDRMTVDLGDLTVELAFHGPSHTKDSITVYVPKDKVLFVGDILFTRYHPYLGDGDFVNWPKVLDQLARIDGVKIIPGHGPVSTKSDLMEMKAYIAAFNTQARVLCAGKKADDAPAIAKELLKRLPEQRRTELPFMVEHNLRARYLPKPQNAK